MGEQTKSAKDEDDMEAVGRKVDALTAKIEDLTKTQEKSARYGAMKAVAYGLIVAVLVALATWVYNYVGSMGPDSYIFEEIRSGHREIPSWAALILLSMIAVQIAFLIKTISIVRDLMSYTKDVTRDITIGFIVLLFIIHQIFLGVMNVDNMIFLSSKTRGNSIYIAMEHDLRSIAPYVGEKRVKLFQSRWATMETYEEYEAIQRDLKPLVENATEENRKLVTPEAPEEATPPSAR